MTAVPSPRILFVMNPRSGGARGLETMRRLRALAAGDSTVDVIDLATAGSTLVSRAAGFDIIVFGGGDGTISTLLPEFAGHAAKFGVLPLGTGNDLARELGIARAIPWGDAAAIVRLFRTLPSREVTRFMIEHGEDFTERMSFINYVSFGFDAKVVAGFQRLRDTKPWKLVRGTLANRIGYALAGIASLPERLVKGSPVHLSRDGDHREIASAKSIIFANIRAVMGLGITNPSGSLFDDRTECIIADSALNYAAMLMHFRFPLFHPEIRGSAAVWELSDLPPGTYVQVDGEPVTRISSSRIRIRAWDRLPMIVGPGT